MLPVVRSASNHGLELIIGTETFVIGFMLIQSKLTRWGSEQFRN